MSHQITNICKTCKKQLVISNFRMRSPTLYRKSCKICEAIAFKVYAEKTKDKRKAYNRDLYEKNKEDKRENKNINGRKYMQTLNGKFANYKADAKRRGKDFQLSFEEFSSFWQSPCSYCGCSIKTIGIDRIDNTIGYCITNIVPACKICNTMKLDVSNDEFIANITKIYNKLIIQ